MEQEPTTQKSFSAPRRWGILLNVAMGIIAVCAIAVMANYLALRYPWHVSLSPNEDTQLRPQTLSLLRALTNQIAIIVFFNKQDVGDLDGLTTTLLNQYTETSTNISVREISPIADFGRATATLAQYKLSTEMLTNRNFILLACGDRTQVIADDEMVDRDFSLVLRQPGAEIPIKDFKGEFALSSAIYRLINPRPIKAYFLRGHGEHDPGSDQVLGYDDFSKMLKTELGIDWAPFAFAGTNQVPADCQLLIIAGPQRRYEQFELDGLQAYLKAGGRALVLLNNALTGSRTGLEDLLQKWNVDVWDVLVTDRDHTPAGRAGEILVSYTAESASHPVMKSIVRFDESMHVCLVAPRMVNPMREVRGADAPEAVCLAATWTNGSSIMRVLNGVAQPNPSTDWKDTSFPLIVAVEQAGAIPGVRPQHNTRLIVTGDSVCFANARLDVGANRDFAKTSVSWLAERPLEVLNGLSPRPFRQYRITLTQVRWQTMNWLLLAAIPGGVLLLGSLVWLRRRS